MNTKKLTLSAMFFALGLILPFVTGHIPAIGRMLSPMHIPVLICGMAVGPAYGAVVGFLVPLVRSLMFGMPAMPMPAVPMAFELCIYGLVSGGMLRFLGRKNIGRVYAAMITAMIAGRIVYGIVQAAVLGLNGSKLTMQMYLTSVFFGSIPGIILQLLIIPTIVMLLGRLQLQEA